MEIKGLSSEQLPSVYTGTTSRAGSPVYGNTDSKSTAESKDKSKETQQQVAKLKETESRVVSHEMAHKSVGGQYAGSANYSYTQGPDGKRYISGGEVSIDVSKERTPPETMMKMKQVRAAALAPADPSPQDLSVAAEAARIDAQAANEQMRTSKNNPYKGTQSLKQQGWHKTAVSVYA